LGSVLVLAVVIFPKFMTNIYAIFASVGILLTLVVAYLLFGNYAYFN